MLIKVSDIVYHQLSKLYYICENKKHENWMNQNPFYILVAEDFPDKSYFYKNK